MIGSGVRAAPSARRAPEAFLDGPRAARNEAIGDGSDARTDQILCGEVLDHRSVRFRSSSARLLEGIDFDLAT